MKKMKSDKMKKIKIYKSRACKIDCPKEIKSKKRCYLLQIPRISINNYNFKSLIRANGRWHLDSFYYCYSGNHRYRRLSKIVSLKIDAIVINGYVQDAVGDFVSFIRRSITQFFSKLNPIRLINNYKSKRELKKVWGDLLDD